MLVFGGCNHHYFTDWDVYSPSFVIVNHCLDRAQDIPEILVERRKDAELGSLGFFLLNKHTVFCGNQKSGENSPVEMVVYLIILRGFSTIQKVVCVGFLHYQQ